ncbi:hypothetical protein [Leptospira idonii]|uniref:3-oxo-5-alpha-steroid 4-dehydrogenase C-terminal domain-containing protein n=1 Tax=Leptospira idonii TaxID=1193500 RepID=A0A4R9LYE1_9LEPT|nr:hypothetical protein [Leptospira idonii]TGN17601.1 hypothetical protein EHS15_16340 [Leptospira idonii]
MILFPQDSLIEITRVIAYLGFGVFLFYLEYTGKFNLPYSKFAENKGVSPKIGMFLVYFLPILGYLSTQDHLTNLSPFQKLTLITFCFHFAKRCLEVLFLHKFSGKMGITGVVLITIAYTNIGLICGRNHNLMNSDYTDKIPSLQIYLAITLFFIGQFGNFFHHVLLRKLRNQTNRTSYVVPEGGMFSILVCPHYFFELLSWFAYSLLSTHWETYLLFFLMSCYLTGRSHQTKLWYKAHIPAFPTERKRIWPYLF